VVRIVAFAVVSMFGLCAVPVLAQDPATVLVEIQRCADLGRKQPGEPANQAMADHIAERFAAAGLDVAREEFHVLVYDLRATLIDVLEPTPMEVPGTSFAYGGTGVVEADVVYVGVGRESDYVGVDAAGKIVLVDRELTFHRSAQLNEVVAHGGAAMLYISAAPDNLMQVGTVRFAQHPPPDIPTVTVGSADGAALRTLAEDGTLRMRLAVDADLRDAVGVNVIATKVGITHPDKFVVVGGHYDSW
jgi:Iap family predicted aminopeptidase